jgi:DNA-binding NarL/FixJ family response regulator
LKRSLPAIKIIFLTVSEDADLATEAFRVGASGFLLKNSAAPELFQAIQEALQGRSYVTPQITGAMVGALMDGPESGRNGNPLTPRQREVLQLLAEGRSMKEIARILNITARTVAFHKYGMMEQLGIKSNAELVQHAIKQHIVSVES